MIQKRFSLFQEALAPSQFRKYVKEFNRKRYEQLFQAQKEKYSGDKNAYRIYLPLVKQDNPTEKEITNYLKTLNIVVLDYVKGQCKFEGAKNPSKIGTVLKKNNKEDLMKKFVEDPVRKAGEDLLVCISRHPYDVAGADTGRDWSNCMTIGSGLNHPALKRMLVKLKDVYQKLAEDPMNSRLESEVNRIKNDIAELRSDGCNVRYLMQDVKQGSLISFLIKASDKNIENPIANLNIKPFENMSKKGDIIFVADRSMYGRGTPEFKETVEKWLDEVNGEMKGLYKLKKGLYDDSGITVVGQYSFKDLVNSPNRPKLKEDAKNINLCNQKLGDLDGLEEYKRVQNLDVSNNSFREIKLSGFNRMVHLNCSYNEKLTRLEINLPELLSLYANNCKIEHVKLETPELEKLVLQNNQIKELELDLPELKELHLNNNKLEKVDLSKCKRLQTLILDSNHLTSIDLSHLKRLTNLQIVRNKLTKLNIENNLKLQRLQVGMNPTLEEIVGISDDIEFGCNGCNLPYRDRMSYKRWKEGDKKEDKKVKGGEIFSWLQDTFDNIIENSDYNESPYRFMDYLSVVVDEIDGWPEYEGGSITLEDSGILEIKNNKLIIWTVDPDRGGNIIIELVWDSGNNFLKVKKVYPEIGTKYEDSDQLDDEEEISRILFDDPGYAERRRDEMHADDDDDGYED